ncbi:MAG: hypothetical protein WBC73_05570 [Phormidesmis sp.]
MIQKPVVFDALAQTASPEGRRETAAKLHRDLIKLNCEFADTQTRELHEYGSSMTRPDESKRIVQCAIEIYSTLMEFYQRSPSASTNGLQETEASPNSPPVGLSVEDTIELSSLIEPLLLEYQDRHQVSDDWAKMGFLTTHLNFSNVALLKNLTTVEKICVEPYFKFLEEQVALPWSRVCAAAGTHQYTSPAFQLVKRMMPKSEEIAQRVYLDLLQQFPRTSMRRGRLDHPGVKHSCIRDLNMFQAYLWLCVMQGSLAPVEDELLRTCTMVMPRVGVPWEMTLKWNEMLMAEVTDRTLLSHQSFLEPYMVRFIQTFQQSKDRFSPES